MDFFTIDEGNPIECKILDEYLEGYPRQKSFFQLVGTEERLSQLNEIIDNAANDDGLRAQIEWTLRDNFGVMGMMMSAFISIAEKALENANESNDEGAIAYIVKRIEALKKNSSSYFLFSK